MKVCGAAQNSVFVSKFNICVKLLIIPFATVGEGLFQKTNVSHLKSNSCGNFCCFNRKNEIKMTLFDIYPQLVLHICVCLFTYMLFVHIDFKLLKGEILFCFMCYTSCPAIRSLCPEHPRNSY